MSLACKKCMRQDTANTNSHDIALANYVYNPKKTQPDPAYISLKWTLALSRAFR